MNKKIASLGLVATLSISMLSGCAVIGDKPEDIPLQPALSQKEVVDYYKQSLAYDTIASRTVKPNQVTYEMQEVTGAAKTKAVAEAEKVEALLSRNSIENNLPLSQSMHQYIKYVLDDKQLSNKKVQAVNEALGYYFVDIEYKLSPKAAGTFNQNMQYVGINGALKQNSSGVISVDTFFMNKAVNEVNKYLAENPSYKTAKSPVSGVRSPLADVSLYNKAAGMSLTQTSMMPPLSFIYNMPAESGISGYGIFPQGSFTLRDFEYSRAKMTGSATIRYVFKKDIMDPTKLDFTNVYVTKYEINNAPKIDESAVIPEFVKTEAEVLLERSDRAISNNDISALMTGKIYDDMGVAVLYGTMQNNCYNQRHMSKIKSVVGRNNHEYLVEYETLTQEGPKGTNTTGTYVESGYMVIQQESTEFHITDFVITKREMTKEPQLNLESTIMKRLAALNLTGEVTKENKEGIKELMQGLYAASTERQLQGMYDCFNTDTNLLSSSHREYLNSQLRGWLLKHGSNTQSQYVGTISQWIGGADNQVEFFTEELIVYSGKSSGQYMQNYYLVSNYGDKWVIDEMKVVESKEVAGEELQAIQSSIQEGKTVSVDGADNKLRDESNDNKEASTQTRNQEQDKDNTEDVSGTNTEDTETQE